MQLKSRQPCNCKIENHSIRTIAAATEDKIIVVKIRDADFKMNFWMYLPKSYKSYRSGASINLIAGRIL